MTDAEEFIKYTETFLKRPILPGQETEIVCALIDGTINLGTAKNLYKWVMQENIKKHNEIMNMSLDEVLALYERVNN